MDMDNKYLDYLFIYLINSGNYRKKVINLDILKNLWDKLDGKKTLTGLALFFVAFWAKHFGLIDDGQFKTIVEIAVPITGVGVFFKGWKFLNN